MKHGEIQTVLFFLSAQLPSNFIYLALIFFLQFFSVLFFNWKRVFARQLKLKALGWKPAGKYLRFDKSFPLFSDTWRDTRSGCEWGCAEGQTSCTHKFSFLASIWKFSSIKNIEAKPPHRTASNVKKLWNLEINVTRSLSSLTSDCLRQNRTLQYNTAKLLADIKKAFLKLQNHCRLHLYFYKKLFFPLNNKVSKVLALSAV